MSNLPAFGAYAADFEKSLQDDDWTRLEQYFSPDASYRPGDGSEARGREGVIQALKTSVALLERKCDSRDLVGEPEISEAGDTVTLKYCLKYTRAGMPDMQLAGYETLQYSNGVIVAMEDVIDDAANVFAWRDALQ